MTPPVPLLSVEDLCVETAGGRGTRVEGVTFRLGRGDIIGITGESGSGKTLTALAVSGLLPRPFTIGGGVIRFRGRPVRPGSTGEIRPGRDILMLFQSPGLALDPWVRVRVQVADTVSAVLGVRAESARETASEALCQAGLPAATHRRYPFQLSGGQRQRVLMAMALALKPPVLIADEPTAGQDERNRAVIIESLRSLAREAGTAVIVISHDLRVLRELSRALVVIYRGRQVESGTMRQLTTAPGHPHTRELVRAMNFLTGAP